MPRSTFKDLRIDGFREYFERLARMTIADTGESIETLAEQACVAVRDEADILRPTVAGLLVFGAHSQNYLPSSRLSVGQFEGSLGGEQIMRRLEEFESNLPRMIDDVTRYVRASCE